MMKCLLWGVCLLAAAAALAAEESTEARYLREHVEVSVVELQARPGIAEIRGEVKNTGDRTLASLVLFVECLDGAGKVVHGGKITAVRAPGNFLRMDDPPPFKPGFVRPFHDYVSEITSLWSGKISVKPLSLEFAQDSGTNAPELPEEHATNGKNSLEFFDIKAHVESGEGSPRTAIIEGRVRNTGNQTVDYLLIRATLLGPDGTAIHEGDKLVLDRRSPSMNAGYVRDFQWAVERVPAAWESAVKLEVLDIHFEGEGGEPKGIRFISPSGAIRQSSALPPPPAPGIPAAPAAVAVPALPTRPTAAPNPPAAFAGAPIAARTIPARPITARALQSPPPPPAPLPPQPTEHPDNSPASGDEPGPLVVTKLTATRVLNGLGARVDGEVRNSGRALVDLADIVVQFLGPDGKPVQEFPVTVGRNQRGGTIVSGEARKFMVGTLEIPSQWSGDVKSELRHVRFFDLSNESDNPTDSRRAWEAFEQSTREALRRASEVRGPQTTPAWKPDYIQLSKDAPKTAQPPAFLPGQDLIECQVTEVHPDFERHRSAIVLAFHGKTDKAIHSWKGVVYLTDLFGDIVETVPFAQGSVLSNWRKSFAAEEGEATALLSATPATLHAEVRPTHVLFEDGSTWLLQDLLDLTK